MLRAHYFFQTQTQELCMTKAQSPQDLYADLDKRVEVQCGDKSVPGTINRICSAELVDVNTDDGRVICAARSKTDSGKWVQAGKDDLWADSSYLMHHPWRPGDEIPIDACVWVPGHGNGGTDFVELPLHGIVV